MKVLILMILLLNNIQSHADISKQARNYPRILEQETNVNFIRKIKNDTTRYFTRTSNLNITNEKINMIKNNTIVQIKSRIICAPYRVILIPKSKILKLVKGYALDNDNRAILADLFSYMINKNIKMPEFTIGCKQLKVSSVNCKLGIGKEYAKNESKNKKYKLKNNFIDKIIYVIYGSIECNYIKSNINELMKLLSEREIQSLKKININEYTRSNEGLTKLDSIYRMINDIHGDVYGILHYYQFKMLTDMCKLVQNWIKIGVSEYRIVEDRILDSRSKEIRNENIDKLSTFIYKYYSIEYRLKIADQVYEYITDTITYI
jgi:hypothetical protein